MNAQILKTYLRPYIASKSIKDPADAADKIATAYDLANVGSSGPFFGAKLIKGDKQTLKTFIQLGLEVNSRIVSISPDKDKIEPGFVLMALGFCLYWLNSTFTPLPPMPPMAAPTSGCQVLFPGLPTPLDKELQDGLRKRDGEEALSGFINALIKHQLTIAGIYGGLVPSVPSPIPLILPWVAVLSIPDISFGTPNFGTGEDGGTGGGGGGNGGDGGGNGGGGGNPNTGKDQDGNDIATVNSLLDSITKAEQDAVTQTQNKVTEAIENLRKLINDALAAGKIISRKANELLSRVNNIVSALADPCFDASTGFDVCEDNRFIDYINLGSDGNLRPIDQIYIDQDQVTHDFFADIIRKKLETNRFKPTLIADNRQRTLRRTEPGYRNNYLGITVELREYVVKRIDGTNEYQFYITLDMQNVGLFPFWDQTQLRFIDAPNGIGFPRDIFTFRDPIESNTSIWAGPPFNITSPKQRGLEIMRRPFEEILDQKIAELNEYIDTWFRGRLRKKLQRIDLYLTTEPREDVIPFGNQVFTKMNNFVKLP